MNNVQKIVHKSRHVEVKFNFTEDGDTSWSFVADGDGEIYEVKTNNIYSYTINGAIRELPYSVAAGESYTISVTKTSIGEADIQLNIRRAVDKYVTYNVPDYSRGNGRYLYSLGENRLFKIDSNLLKASNYTNSGAWTVSPYIEITLPTLPSDGVNTNVFTGMEWVVVNGEELLLLMSFSKNVDFRAWGCYIKSDGTVWDLDFTTQDSITNVITNVYSNKAQSNDLKSTLYDYINNFVIFYNSGGSAFTLDLSTNEGTTNFIFDGRFKTMLQFQSMFIPETNLFVGFADLNPSGRILENYKDAPNYIYTAAYAAESGYVLSARWASDIIYYSKKGAVVGGSVKRDLGVLYNCKGLKYSGATMKILATSSHINNSYVFHELDENDTIDLPAQTLQVVNIASSQTYIEMPTHLTLNDIWVCKGADGNGKNRIYFFNSSLINSDYAYLDLPTNVMSLKSNRYDK